MTSYTRQIFKSSQFAVKSAGPGGQARIKSLKVVRCPDNEQPIVTFQSIQLVEEERAVLVSYQAFVR